MSQTEANKSKARSCPNGHVFEDKELEYCPECGLPLRDISIKEQPSSAHITSQNSTQENTNGNRVILSENTPQKNPNDSPQMEQSSAEKVKKAKKQLRIILLLLMLCIVIVGIICGVRYKAGNNTTETIVPTEISTPEPTAKPTATPTPKPAVTNTPRSNSPDKEGAAFGFDLTASELNTKAMGLYKVAVKWTQSTVPQNLKDFPLIPAYLTYYENEVENLDTSLVISGKKAVWTSNAEDLYSGDYGITSYDRCYGWTQSGKDITFNKTKKNTFESIASQNASDVYYVRQERGWTSGDWEYTFNIDFFEANIKNGGRITFIGMYNPKNGMDVHWQINSQMNNEVYIHVYLNNDSKYFSLDYDLNTGRLLSCNYSN